MTNSGHFFFSHTHTKMRGHLERQKIIYSCEKITTKFISYLSAVSMVVSGVAVFFLPIVHNKIQNLLISCVFGAVSTVGWNALDVLQAELFPTAVRYVC